MAASNKVEGYDCDFVDQVPEDYFCKHCKHVAMEPNITSCCGETFCKECINFFKQCSEGRCPNCQDIDLSSLFQPKFHSRILALEVYCSLKDRGCEWTGQLQHLDAHLDLTTGDCVYVDVDCPNKCDQKVQKCNVATHLANHCPNRDYTCPHCSFKATFRDVSEHFEVCEYYPLVCPNRCGASFEQGVLQNHLKMCGLQKVQCEFSYAGCEAEFIRDHQKEHMEQNTQKHLALVAAATLRISQELGQKNQEKETEEVQESFNDRDSIDIKTTALQVHKQTVKQLKDFQKKIEDQMQNFQQRLMEQQEIFEHKLEEQWQVFEQKLVEQQQLFEHKLGMKQQQISNLEQKLGQQQILEQGTEVPIAKTIPENGEKVEDEVYYVETKPCSRFNSMCMELGYPPYEITLSDYQEKKLGNIWFDFPLMYTHPRGWAFKLRVWPNGHESGYCTHLSVGVYSLFGDHDYKYIFPAKFAIKLELLNQHRDQHHHMRNVPCEVTKKKIGCIAYDIGHDWEFISLSELKWKADTQTQYLKDDCLKLMLYITVCA